MVSNGTGKQCQIEGTMAWFVNYICIQLYKPKYLFWFYMPWSYESCHVTDTKLLQIQLILIEMEATHHREQDEKYHW